MSFLVLSGSLTEIVVQFFALELPDAQILRIRRPEREETPYCEVIASQGLMLHNLFFCHAWDPSVLFLRGLLRSFILLHSFDFRTFQSFFARMTTTH